MNRTMVRMGYFIAILAGLIGLIAGCGGNNGGGPSANPDTTAPTVSGINVASGSALDFHGQVVITFSEPMNTGSLVLGGTMAGESDNGVWSSGTITKATLGAALKAEADQDRLTVSPASSWSTGNDRTLSIDVKDLAGNALETLNLTYNVVMGIVYVSPIGDDANDGTKSSPKKTIPGGIGAAVNQNMIPGAVAVAEGIYQVNSGAAAPTHVILTEGISIYGGYSDDLSHRDPKANTTTIEDQSAKIISSGLPNRALEAGSGVTEATIVDGFTILGGKGNYSSGVLTRGGGAPMLVDNIVNGGSGSSNSYGVYNDVSSPSIVNNTIDGGGGGSGSVGVANFTSSPSIRNNDIHGGRGSISYGVYNSSHIYDAHPSAPLIQNNTINGGGGGFNSTGVFNTYSSPSILNNTIDGGGGSSFSRGVYNSYSSPSIRNNTISGGEGSSDSFGVYNSSSGSLIQNNTINGGGGSSNSYGIYTSSYPTIQNNIVFTSGSGKGYCIAESAPVIANEPASVQNNDLFNCPTALYLDEGSVPLASIDDVNKLTQTTSGGNVSIDPEFVDVAGADGDIHTMADNDWHLSSASPTEVTQGGLDLSSDFTTDKDGTTRTIPWSMGAYERD